MNPQYRDKISKLVKKTGDAMAQAQDEAGITAAQNEFNNTLNAIKAEAKARPNGVPDRKPPSDPSPALKPAG